MSEKRRNKGRAQHSSSKFQLKLSNSSRSEEHSVKSGNVTPNRRADKCADHSTPIRNANVNNAMEDSPEIDYRCSPIMGPCTQQNEVVWNWNSPKEEAIHDQDIRTPKRTAQFQKRRINESPLMYPPYKVKHKKEKRDIDMFIANFEVFKNQVVEKQEEELPVPSTSENCQFEVQNQMNIDKNLETSEDSDMKLVLPDEESAIDMFCEKQNFTNLNQFFDDEIDESMVRCSQQVEEEFLNRINQQQEKENGPTVLPFCEEKQQTNTGQSLVIDKNEGLHEFTKFPSEKPKEAETKKQETDAVKQKSILIPDDSFDEYLSQVEVDDFTAAILSAESSQSKQPNGLYIRQNDYVPKKSLFSSSSNNTCVKVGTSSKLSTVTEEKRSNNASSNERLFSKTKSFDFAHEPYRNTNKNKTDLIQKSEKKSESLVTSRKFFKSKSVSEPFSNDSKNSCILNKSRATVTNTYNPSTENSPKITGKSFQCKIYSDSSLNKSIGNSNNKTIGSSQDNLIKLGNNFDNTQLSNLNRSMEKFQAKRTDDSQKIFFTPAEIERKRIEAKMKLEAKRKMILNSKTTNGSSNLSFSQSIKR